MRKKQRKITFIVIAILVIVLALSIYLQTKNNPALSPVFNSLNEYFSQASKYTSQLTDQQIVNFVDNQIVAQGQDPTLVSLRASMNFEQVAMVARGTIQGQELANAWTSQQQYAAVSFINKALVSQQAMLLSPFVFGPTDHSEYFRIRSIVVEAEGTFKKDCTLGSCGWVNCNSLNQGQVCVCSGEEASWSDWIQCDGTCKAGADGSCKEKVGQ